MMGGGNLTWLGKPIELCLLDLLLCGDNALVIVIACRALPPHLRGRAVNFGIVGAVLVRFVMTACATAVFNIPGLKIGGALLLLLIALNVAAAGDDDKRAAGADDASPAPFGGNLWGTAILILCADIIMSLDNTVALAAVAQGNLGWLALGLLLTIPALLFGAKIMIALIARHPGVMIAGGMFLGWIAGDMAVSDAAVAGSIGVQAQALPYILPPLLAFYIFAQARVTASRDR